MINRENYLLVKRFIEYRREVLQNDPLTCETYWHSLRHLLEWLDDKSFLKAENVRPTFPEYLLTARNEQHPRHDKDTSPLTPKYMVKVLSNSRAFFEWLHASQVGYRAIRESWIETLVVRKTLVQSRLVSRKYWTVEELTALASLKPKSIRHERDIAATCFLFLSGMRIGAFVTLPVSCVDIEARKVYQLPELGVQTKNSKAAVTFLLNVSPFFEVVSAWHKKVVEAGQPNKTSWYAYLRNDEIVEGLCGEKYTGRFTAYTQGLKELCALAGIEYKSPHKLRHGHGVFGVKHAKNIAELKAISQNLMHANIGITDGIYGRLAEDDLAKILEGFGR